MAWSGLVGAEVRMSGRPVFLSSPVGSIAGTSELAGIGALGRTGIAPRGSDDGFAIMDFGVTNGAVTGSSGRIRDVSVLAGIGVPGRTGIVLRGSEDGLFILDFGSINGTVAGSSGGIWDDSVLVAIGAL